MSIAPLFIIALAIYGVPTLVGMLVAYRIAGKDLNPIFVLHLAVPICSWILLVMLRDKGKTLSNLVIEPLVLAGVVCAVVGAYLVGESKGLCGGKFLDILTVVVLFLITVGVFLLVPALPE